MSLKVRVLVYVVASWAQARMLIGRSSHQLLSSEKVVSYAGGMMCCWRPMRLQIPLPSTIKLSVPCLAGLYNDWHGLMEHSKELQLLAI